MGGIPIAGWFIGWKIHLQMDENCGYPHDESETFMYSNARYEPFNGYEFWTSSHNFHCNSGWLNLWNPHVSFVSRLTVISYFWWVKSPGLCSIPQSSYNDELSMYCAKYIQIYGQYMVHIHIYIYIYMHICARTSIEWLPRGLFVQGSKLKP